MGLELKCQYWANILERRAMAHVLQWHMRNVVIKILKLLHVQLLNLIDLEKFLIFSCALKSKMLTSILSKRPHQLTLMDLCHLGWKRSTLQEFGLKNNFFVRKTDFEPDFILDIDVKMAEIVRAGIDEDNSTVYSGCTVTHSAVLPKLA